jgi:hypothetical protein
MELFVLGLVFGVGAAKRKAVTKAVAKGYMAVTDRTKSAASALREDMRDAIEEARYEREVNDEAQEGDAGAQDVEAVALHEETLDLPAAVPAAEAKPKGSIMKSLVRGYVAMTDKTRQAAAGLREEVRDAIEEARYEREQAALRAEQEADAPETVAETAAAAVLTPEAGSEGEEAQPKAKRKYTRNPAVEVAVAGTAKKTSGTKPTKTAQTAASANGTTPPRRGRPKTTAGEKETAMKTVEHALEVVEIIAEATL